MVKECRTYNWWLQGTITTKASLKPPQHIYLSIYRSKKMGVYLDSACIELHPVKVKIFVNVIRDSYIY